MPAERYGRRTSIDATGLAQNGGQDAALAPACSLHAMDPQPEAYEPHLDVDFTKLNPEGEAG